MPIGTASNQVLIFFLSLYDQTRTFTLEPLITNTVTGLLPYVPLDSTLKMQIADLQLADPEFYSPSCVDILIGGELFYQLLLDGERQIAGSNLYARKTQIGWIIAGDCKLEVLSSSSSLSSEEQFCEDHFSQTHVRDSDGRFVVILPLRKELQLGDSKDIALKRIRSIEQRFIHQPQFKDEYNKFMEEYIRLEHMREVNESQNIQETYYLLHHAVVKPDSTTTKLHVAFDGSAKPANGVSLNDKLCVGPKVQSDLIDIILRFRFHNVAFITDIEKMYRQIRVVEQDLDYQRILWREKATDSIKSYQLTTVTYGTSAAPYLATRCLIQMARSAEETLPLANKIALRDYYVDDLMSGALSLSEALDIQDQLLKLCRSAGFTLRRWTSNCRELQSANESSHPDNELNILLKNDTIKALGITWNPREEVFFFNRCIFKTSKTTKRIVLAEVSQLFDPAGWAAPVIIRAKLLIQQLWILGISWDDDISTAMATAWHSYKSDITTLHTLKIPRQLFPCSIKVVSYELHGFADASERAYAAAIYLRTADHDGIITTRLICAKTRVAPVRQVTLPRLELCGAHLLSKLITRLINSLPVKFDSVMDGFKHCIVLDLKLPRRWKTFVANCVLEIQDMIPSHQWRHVSSEDNPADCASRGITSSELSNSMLWWHRPS